MEEKGKRNRYIQQPVQMGNDEEDNCEERETCRRLSIYCWGKQLKSVGSDVRVRGSGVWRQMM